MKLFDLVKENGLGKKLHLKTKPDNWWFIPERTLFEYDNVFIGINSEEVEEVWGVEGDEDAFGGGWELLNENSSPQ